MTSGSSSSASVSARSAMAPTGVFSSWLMLATRSVRTESSRTRSLTSSIVLMAPTCWPSTDTTEPRTTSVRRGGP